MGADAETVEKAVTIPLEEAINGVEGMRYISSSSTNSGTSRDRHHLPDRLQPGHRGGGRAESRGQRAGAVAGAVDSTGINITKSNFNFVFGAGFFTLDDRYSNEYISNYLDVYVKDALKRVPGVGDVMIFGERKYAMRVWLDPVRLAARGLTATDVVNALEEQNVEIPAGQLGQPPTECKAGVSDSGARGGPAYESRRVRQHHRQEFVQRTGAAEGRGPRGGGRGRLQHPARIRGPSGDGHWRGATFERQRAGSGPQAKAALTELSKNFPPGLEYAIAFDSTTAVGDSIREVLITLVKPSSSSSP